MRDTVLGGTVDVARKTVVFLDDESAPVVDGEAPRFKAIEQGKRIAVAAGVDVHPMTARDANGFPILDIAVLANELESVILAKPVVAIIVDVMQHKKLRAGVELLEFLFKNRRQVIDSVRGIFVWTKDGTVKREEAKLRVLFPRHFVAVFDRNTEFHALITELKKL